MTSRSAMGIRSREVPTGATGGFASRAIRER